MTMCNFVEVRRPLQLINPDIVPESVNKELWSAAAECLNDIVPEEFGADEFNRYARSVRNAIRLLRWKYEMKHVSDEEFNQLEFFVVQIMLRKAVRNGERRIIEIECGPRGDDC